MRRITFIGLILLVCVSVQGQGSGTVCTQVFNFDAFYSLLLLKVDNYYSYIMTKEQGNFTYTLPETETVTPPSLSYQNLHLFYNFCSPVSFKETENCASQVNAIPPSFALTLTPLTPTTTYACSEADNTMVKLTSDSRFDNFEIEQIDPAAPHLGLLYTLTRSNTTYDTSTPPVAKTFNTTITYIMYCDTKPVETIPITINGWRQVSNATNLHYYFQATSKYGCPTLEISKIWQILESNSVLFTVVMVALGVVLCFFGLKIYQPTMFAIGYMTGFGGIVVIMGEFVIRYDSESIMAYACLVIAVLFGVLTGYVTITLPKIGFFALGMWLGVVIALLCNNAFLYKIQVANQFVVLWVTIAVLAISMGLLSCFFYKYCVMISTGFIGSYCLIRPFGWIIGSFPNELQLAKELKYGTMTTVPNLFYLYFALIILIGLIGIRFQWSMYSSRRKEEEEDDLQLYLADPDFMELNKSLLDKDDQDLTEKERKVKNKLIRMQKNLEKEKKRQEEVQKKIEKYRKHEKGSDGEDEDSDEDYKEGGNTRKSGKNNILSPLNIFETSAGASTKRKSISKSQVLKKKKATAVESDSEEEEDDNEKQMKKQPAKKQRNLSPEVVTEKDSSKKFSQMFAGIKSNKAKEEQTRPVPDIEMEDLNDSSYLEQQNETQTTAINRTKVEEQKKNSDHSDSEQEEDVEQQTKAQKKKKNENAANIAKKAKKGKR